MEDSNYTKFVLMLICSAVAMCIAMFFNTYEIYHVFFSWTSMYMTLIGIGGMAIIMFLFIRNMYKDKIKNIAILVGSVFLMVISTFLVRQQIPIDDVKWLPAMNPHHSIVILTSKKAATQDPEVKRLAGEIIKVQKREKAEMKMMIHRLENDN